MVTFTTLQATDQVNPTFYELRAGYPEPDYDWYREKDQNGIGTLIAPRYTQERFVTGFHLTCGEFYTTREDVAMHFRTIGLLGISEWNTPEAKFQLYRTYDYLRKQLQQYSHARSSRSLPAYWRDTMIVHLTSRTHSWLKETSSSLSMRRHLIGLPQQYGHGVQSGRHHHLQGSSNTTSYDYDKTVARSLEGVQGIDEDGMIFQDVYDSDIRIHSVPGLRGILLEDLKALLRILNPPINVSEDEFAITLPLPNSRISITRLDRTKTPQIVFALDALTTCNKNEFAERLLTRFFRFIESESLPPDELTFSCLFILDNPLYSLKQYPIKGKKKMSFGNYQAEKEWQVEDKLRKLAAFTMRFKSMTTGEAMDIAVVNPSSGEVTVEIASLVYLAIGKASNRKSMTPPTKALQRLLAGIEKNTYTLPVVIELTAHLGLQGYVERLLNVSQALEDRTILHVGIAVYYPAKIKDRSFLLEVFLSASCCLE
ncbi:hypothetical protein FB567DRAFT_630692 [Paraphoma chrysanthemicola]|uniref:Uncharacterized protein n=1 Tax=Paraphoma chrysanthemicola TaxID=798071 RepID=A0A8K0R0U8_9PLEO|nr:hypothetical protein FB567DRAFT_630692 [Paraphoma chrysanthemicola]